VRCASQPDHLHNTDSKSQPPRGIVSAVLTSRWARSSGSPSESRKFPTLGTLVNRQRRSSASTARNQNRLQSLSTPTNFWFDDRFWRFPLGSQIYPLRTAAALWLTAGRPAPVKMANSCGTPSLRGATDSPGTARRRRAGSTFSDSQLRAACLVNCHPRVRRERGQRSHRDGNRASMHA
jgi:hypothetical protein